MRTKKMPEYGFLEPYFAFGIFSSINMGLGQYYHKFHIVFLT
jgi:hypothetical protein